jgi:hypothetical protein
VSEYIPIALRKRVHSHFLESCGYCKTQEYLTVVTFEVEHIVPRSLGGATEFDNLCLACPSCNRFKSNRVKGVSEDGQECRLFHPHKDLWLEHFDWSVNGTLIVGLTDIGHATIQLLRMNRPALIEVRSLWVLLGKHPPN